MTVLNNFFNLKKAERNWCLAALCVASILLILRIIALFLDPNSLYADETQYWIWSQTLDWGYYSKPPMIAWVIALTTSIFGDWDWSVRLASPVLHTLTACFLGLAAIRFYDVRVGALTTILWLMMPAVWLSANLISTDVVLMTGWSMGLFALASLRIRPNWQYAVLLGLAASWAFLSKYAAIYLLLGLVISFVIDTQTRRALWHLRGLIALFVFLGLITPNLIWNAHNEFATLSHTAANANWVGSLFHPGELITFLIDQLGVFGPIFFPMMIIAAVQAVRAHDLSNTKANPALILTGFIFPVLIIVTIQAFISRAHANWAASAYGAGTILLAVFILNGPKWRQMALWIGLGLHSLAGLTLMVTAISPPLSETLGVANAFKRVREWPTTIQTIESAVQRSGVTHIVFDNRNDFHQFQRYGTDIPAEPFVWLRQASPQNFAETNWSLPYPLSESVLIVSERHHEIPLIERDFKHFEFFDEIRIPLGGDKYRHYKLYLASGHNRITRDQDYEIWVRQLRMGSPD